MKTILCAIIVVSFLSCETKTTPQNVNVPAMTLTKEDHIQAVTQALADFDQAYQENNDAAFRNFLAKDLMVYGTDPREVWPYEVFQHHIPDTQNKNLPKLTLVKQNSLYVNGTGTSACVVRELSYQPTFDNNLRQTIYMEKDGENWLVKMISLGHLLPNGQ